MNVANGGANGVALFFILSGFVLAYNYAAPEKAGTLNKAEFWKARFARIYPVYFLALLLTVPRFVDYVHYLLRPASSANVIKALTSFALVVSLTQAWDATQATVWNYPAWTLSVEMFFYLTFPWTCAVVCKLKARNALIGIWGMSLMGTGAAFLMLHPGGRILSFMNLPGVHALTAFLRSLDASWPPLRLPEFLIGLVLGRLYVARPEVRIRHSDLISVLATIGIVAVAALGQLPGQLNTRLLEPLFGLLIYALAPGTGRFAGFLSLPGLVLLGEASYAIYILQVPIMTYVYGLLGHYGMTFVAGLLVLIGVSVASFVFFETPARKWLRKKWSPPRPVLQPQGVGA